MSMRKLMLLSAAGAGLLCLSGPALAQSCGDLWYARNEIYKAQGYCFKTARAIRAFGNAGCQYDDLADVPLSQAQRRAIADIVRDERFAGCPR